MLPELSKYQRLIAILGVAVLLVPLPSRGQVPYRVSGSPEEIALAADVYAVRPVWSPDVSKPRIAFTTTNYRGLWIKDLTDASVSVLTDERAAGFGFRWSADGTAILVRVATYEGLRRNDAVKVYMTDVVSVQQMSAPGRRIRSLPEWTEGGEAVVVEAGRRHRRYEDPLRTGKTASPTSAILARDNMVVRVMPDGSDQVLGRYQNAVLNLTVSPDRSLIAFEILGGDLVVLGADGSSQSSLGRGSRPSWSPDSRWLVFMLAEDDGHNITSSDLMLGSASGETWKLTDTPQIREMNPSWSPRGDRIAYDFDGRLYMLPISETR